jgi:hypothetical protein
MAQFAATWDAVSQRLHAHGKTIAVCIADGQVHSSVPNMTQVSYTDSWAYTAYIPFVDVITDMATYEPKWSCKVTPEDPCTNISAVRIVQTCGSCDNFGFSSSAPDTPIPGPNGWQVPTPVRMYELGRWTHAAGLVLDQIQNGVDAPSGQLSPGMWFDQCYPNGSLTHTGWRQTRTSQGFSASLIPKGCAVWI